MKTIFFFLFFFLSLQQYCLSNEGKKVSWWAVLKVPPKIGNSGFGYLDSNSKQLSFNYFNNKIDFETTALTQTLNQINSLKLETVAWNDQKPNGQVSYTKAHSKGLISFSFNLKIGFLLSHSIPKYPAFIENRVNITIGQGQNIYGQHLFCTSMSINKLDELAENFMTTHLYVYFSNVLDGKSTHNLYLLGQGQQTTPSTNFQYKQFTLANLAKLKSIFKNGAKNCSIFEDGMTTYLKQSLSAQTWGRPLSKSWCHSPYTVTNILKVKVGTLQWKEQDDHSKWVVSNNYACFGDMNRMDSQWKRGGSFFCLQTSNVVKALRKTVLQEQKCNKNKIKYDLQNY